MYFMALATDYDGTIARDGVVAKATVAALMRFKESRKIVLDAVRKRYTAPAHAPDEK